MVDFCPNLGCRSHSGASVHRYGGWHAVRVDHFPVHVSDLPDVPCGFGPLSTQQRFANEFNDIRQQLGNLVWPPFLDHSLVYQ